MKDLELVVIPAFGEPLDLFSEQRENLLYRWAQTMEAEGRIQWIKPGTDEIEPWPPKPDGRYWRGLMVKASERLGQPIKLDLFITTPERWGATFLIRTGCAEFSQAVVTYAHSVNCLFDRGLFYKNGRVIETPEEEAIFETLGIEWVEPTERHSAQAVRAA